MEKVGTQGSWAAPVQPGTSLEVRGVLPRESRAQGLEKMHQGAGRQCQGAGCVCGGVLEAGVGTIRTCQLQPPHFAAH